MSQKPQGKELRDKIVDYYSDNKFFINFLLTGANEVNSQDILLFLFEIFILVSALGVVLLPNLVYSAFLLALVLVGMSGLYILLNADFLAAAQILVYVGAINVLILFAVMLVAGPTILQLPQKPTPFRLTATALSGLSFFTISGMILNTNWPKPPFVQKESSNFLILSNHLFSDFLLPFEIVSLILLIALIGAVLLARKDKPSNVFSFFVSSSPTAGSIIATSIRPSLPQGELEFRPQGQNLSQKPQG